MARRGTLTVIPAAVVEWRKARGMTQTQLAAASGCSEALIAHAERGTRNLSRESLERIAAALTIPPAALAHLHDEVA